MKVPVALPHMPFAPAPIEQRRMTRERRPARGDERLALESGRGEGLVVDRNHLGDAAPAAEFRGRLCRVVKRGDRFGERAEQPRGEAAYVDQRRENADERIEPIISIDGLRSAVFDVVGRRAR